MKYFELSVCFAMAVVGAYLGATGKKFYGGGVGRLAINNPIPTWFGRLWFFGFAVVMVYLGIRSLR